MFHLLLHLMLQERAHLTRMVPPGPLPEESSFVADARDLIPQRRTNTTATVRGRTTMASRGKRRATTQVVPNAGTDCLT